MQKKHLGSILLLTATIFLLAPGCLKQKNKTHELEGPALSESTVERSDVTVQVTKLNTNNTQMFTKKTLHKFYQPVEISITNNTNDTYSLNRHDVNINIEPTRKVARRLHKNLVIAFFWPLAYTNALKAHVTMGTTIAFLTMPTLWPIWLGIRLSSDAILTSYDNKRIKKHFRNYTTDLIGGLNIAPHSTVKKFIYIRKEYYRPNFEMRLTNTRSSNHLNYSIRLNK